ncbi:MAG: NAD(P)H-dependent oxidoreductase [Phycisphaeraceae bacterium]|nr:NAD(P)H-dependent oxidoreductase [Phycisphaeraceae bacterium]
MDLIILGHPDPGSFNHAIACRAADTLRSLRREVVLHDLYAESFPPLLARGEAAREAKLEPAIARHCEELAAAELIVIVHPNWWGMPPAIVAGWVDRVVRPGVAYQFNEGDSGEGVPEGLLRARAAIVFNTANTEAAREQAVFGDPLQRIWRDCVFGLCGVGAFHRLTFETIITSSPEQRRQWLDDVEKLIRLAAVEP